MDSISQYEFLPEIQHLLACKPKKPLPLLPQRKPEPGREEIKRVYKEWESAVLSIITNYEEQKRQVLVQRMETEREATRQQELRVKQEAKRQELRTQQELLARKEQEERAKEAERVRKDEERMLKEAKREENRKKKQERERVKELVRIDRGISKEEEEQENKIRREALGIKRVEKKETENQLFQKRLLALQKEESRYTPDEFRTMVRQLLLSRTQKTSAANKSMITMGAIGTTPFLMKWITTIISHHERQIEVITKTVIRGRRELIAECVEWGEEEDALYQQRLLTKYEKIVSELQIEIKELKTFESKKNA